MSDTALINIFLGHQKRYPDIYQNNIQQQLLIPLECPYCFAKESHVATWGTYQTKEREIPRYYCYNCEKTFNPAKLPFWKSTCSEILWKLAQLTIEDKVSVHSLAEKYNLPQSTLYLLLTRLKIFLASSYELGKQLYDHMHKNDEKNKEELRIVAYDEGFLRLLGVSAYLLFTLDKKGRPLTLQIEENRTAETVYNHLLTASTQLGGIHVFIADGGPAILSAVRALRSDLLFIRHIHKGSAKRAQIMKYTIQPEKKKIIETVIELHTGSLLPNTESIITVTVKEQYPTTFAGNKVSKINPETKKKRKK